MPAVSRKKEISPLDDKLRSTEMEHLCKPDPDSSCLKDNETYKALHSLAVLVLCGRQKDTHSSSQEASLLTQVCMDSLRNGLPLYIEVNGKARMTNEEKSDVSIVKLDDLQQPFGSDVLIEKWMLQLVPTRESGPNSVTSIKFLAQAMKSFLYFSQINSWSVSNGGRLPFNLVHRTYSTSCSTVSSNSFQFGCPDTHEFPLAYLDQLCLYVHVSVTFLPRLNSIPSQLLLFEAPFDTNSSNNKSEEESSNGHPFVPPSLSTVARQPNPAVVSCNQDIAIAPPTTIKAPYIQQSQVHKLFTTLDNIETGDSLSVPKQTIENAGFPFSPPNPSPLSHKVLSTLLDKVETETVDGSPPVTQLPISRKGLDLDPLDLLRLSLSNDEVLCSNGSSSSNKTHPTSSLPVNERSGSSRMIISKLGKALTCVSTTIPQTATPLTTMPRTATPLTIEGRLSCPLWIDNNKSRGVRPPGASSPIPFLLRRHTSTNGCDSTNSRDTREKLKRRSCGVYFKSAAASCHPPPTRSMSLPAVVPNLCLLGTFEESVLNGRIDPLGHVEGFTAELGASGSFCPSHITLPVSASFFSLSDDGGPSPYLGHIDLCSLRKRRGYRVPRKGTVQLTLFNPNKTVVKIFIVTYDHTDMPSNTATFIRQKTLSRLTHAMDNDLILPSLQFLIHLRYLCSKSGHVYLHTDIKLLFAQRAPDTDPDLSKMSLFTILEGPLNPKYGPLSKELC